MSPPMAASWGGSYKESIGRIRINPYCSAIPVCKSYHVRWLPKLGALLIVSLTQFSYEKPRLANLLEGDRPICYQHYNHKLHLLGRFRMQ